MTATLKFIGTIRTPYKTLEDCPRNVDPENGPECEVVLDEPYRDGLQGLVPGQKILVLYWFEGVDRDRVLTVRRRFPDENPRGTFSLRSPHRPNPIAAAEVVALEIGNGRIVVKGLDCLDGTKLLDIKPAMKPDQ